jgi:hypothetical protein
MTFGAAVPSGKVAKGDTWRYRLLFACFAPKPEEMNEAAEEIRVQYGLVGPPGYPCSVKHGELLSTVYELRLKAAEGAATVEVGRASLAGALPIVVEGLNERWSAVIAEGEAARFIGVSEGRGYAVADVRDQGHTLFVGHPVRCGDPNVCLELIDWSLDRATVEAHNPTEQPIKTWIAASPACAFVPQAKAEVALDPGVSKRVELRRG